MPNRSKSQNRKKQSPRASPQKVRCTELLIVDQTPFLKKALSTCKRLRNELHKKQALLNDFEAHDRDAFQKWLSHTHGKTLTQIRERQEEANDYNFILHHLSHCAYYNYDAVPALYEELIERKKNGTLHSYVPPEAEDSDDEDAWDDDVFEDDDDESFDDFFDRVFEGRGAHEGTRPRELHKQRKQEDARLKTCYRNLAKRLHPDHSELDEVVREKRWHEIQEAYQNGDLDGLLRVEAICDMDATGLSAELGLARLRDLADYHKSHLIPLRNALRNAKQDIAFGFKKRGPTSELKEEVAGGLKQQRRELKERVYACKSMARDLYEEVKAFLKEEEARAARADRRLSEIVSGRKRGTVKTTHDSAQMTFF